MKYRLRLTYPNGVRAEPVVPARDGADVERILQQMDLPVSMRSVNWEPVEGADEIWAYELAFGLEA